MKTMNDLVSEYNTLATELGRPARKGFDNKAKAEAALKALKALKRKSSGGALRVRKAGAVRSAGPRGFRFGPVWIASIKSGDGIAYSPRNFPKLRQMGEAYGIDGSLTATDQAALASTIREMRLIPATSTTDGMRVTSLAPT